MIKMSFAENPKRPAVDGLTILTKRSEVKQAFWERHANFLNKIPLVLRWLVKFLFRIRLHFVLQKEIDRLYARKPSY